MKKILLFIIVMPFFNLTNAQNNHITNNANDTIILAEKPTKDTINNDEDFERVFTEAQVKPEFPGGINGWLKYLERNINRDLPYKNGAPPGRYTVLLSFIVAKNGTINDIKAETDPGYGSKEEAIRLMARSPKWKPAVQNGRNVIFRQKQSITFVVI
jgi:protein TonB